jgi:hypothetical protein
VRQQPHDLGDIGNAAGSLVHPRAPMGNIVTPPTRFVNDGGKRRGVTAAG